MTNIYIVEPGSYLKVKHQQFHIVLQKQLLFQVPVNQVENIILFGYCHLSHGAVQTALFRKIPIIYYSHQGYYIGSLQSQQKSQATYLKEQVRLSENEDFVRRQAEIIVRGKLHNARILLMRINRRRPNEKTEKAITELKKLIKSFPINPSLQSLRGYEGRGASIYFQGLSPLLQGGLVFEKRTLRPPADPINSLLGFGYTLLCQHLIATVQLAGLHTDFGNLHSPRDNHPALVLDLMEEFRAQIVDSLVVYFVNKKIFSPQDFTPPNEKGGVYLKQEPLKIFLKHWSEKLSTQLTHPQTQRKVTLRSCMELQVQNYISCLQGKTENYRPMLWQK